MEHKLADSGFSLKVEEEDQLLLLVKIIFTLGHVRAQEHQNCMKIVKYLVFIISVCAPPYP